jgi:N-carbamoyl-L-amino-acid hydrolase
VRQLVRDMGGAQVGTVGVTELQPNLINVIANRARFTVDLRNTDEALLQEAERRLFAFVDEAVSSEGVTVERRQLVRFQPVVFDAAMAGLIERIARTQGHTTMRLPSGAGHDAQMMARLCPTGMIFVPSVGGLSHNVAEYTTPADLEAGAAVLLDALMALAED